jgi:hypothetical protein
VSDEMVGQWRRPMWFRVRHLIESVGETCLWGTTSTTSAVRFVCGTIAYATDLHADEPDRRQCAKCCRKGADCG